LNETFKGLNFEVFDGLLKVGFKKKGFFFSKEVQVLLKEDAQSVKNEQPDIRAIGLRVMTEKRFGGALAKGTLSKGRRARIFESLGSHNQNREVRQSSQTVQEKGFL
jgi:hypothetical protein